MVETSELTYRQLEERLSQRVMNTYITLLGHQPRQVSCKLADKTLTIIVEGSITKPEQLLTRQGNQPLAEQVRYNIQKALQSHIKLLVEESFAVPVIDILSSSKPNTNHASIIAILEATPQVQSSYKVVQAKQEKELEKDDGG